VYHRASKSSVHAGAFRRLDITAEQQHTLKMVKRPTFRPKQELVDELMAARKAGRFVRWSTVQTPHIFSTEPEERLVPDITDQPSVLALAEMSFNAYTELGKSGDWYDLGSKWRVVKNKVVDDALFFLHNHPFFSLYRITHLVGRRMDFEDMYLVIMINHY
jgi:putative lipase involved disintegration of autophagic bodies